MAKQRKEEQKNKWTATTKGKKIVIIEERKANKKFRKQTIQKQEKEKKKQKQFAKNTKTLTNRNVRGARTVRIYQIFTHRD